MTIPKMFFEFSTLRAEMPKENILMLRLSRPEVRNALNTAMIRELGAVWTELRQAAHDLRAVILTGEGSKAFCAGADLKEKYGMSADAWRAQHEILEDTMRAMISCPTPVLAAVNGAAFGGGLELTLASDFAYAVPEATFAFPETRLGIIPGAMGTQLLPRAVGLNRAKEICLTGATFTAAEACEWGIINKVVDRRNLLDEIIVCAASIAAGAPIAITQIKRSLNATMSLDIVSGYHFEIEAYNVCVNSSDRDEGIRAFNEKRRPNFRGE